MYIGGSIAGMIVQVLIGLALATPILLKLYWGKIKEFVRRRRRDDGD